MSERIYEEVAVIVKLNYTIRLLGYKENGNEFTEINVYSKKVIEVNDELSDYFAFGFTLKGRWEKEKAKIEKMNEREFAEFIGQMTHVIERKYHVVHQKEEEKKEEKKEEQKKEEKEDEKSKSVIDTFDNLEDFDASPQTENSR